MIRKIYICDKCGVETEISDNMTNIQSVAYEGGLRYHKMVCKVCEKDIRMLIDNNFMVLDPEELRK